MDWPMILLRLGVGGLFINAAYQCARFFEWTASDTALLVGERLKKPAAIVGIAMMLLGGLSVLFDYQMRVGAALLAVFLVGGTIIHRKQEALAFALRDQIKATSTGTLPSSIDALAGLAKGGHLSSWLKNLALLGVVLYLAFGGWTGLSSPSD